MTMLWLLSSSFMTSTMMTTALFVPSRAVFRFIPTPYFLLPNRHHHHPAFLGNHLSPLYVESNDEEHELPHPPSTPPPPTSFISITTTTTETTTSSSSSTSSSKSLWTRLDEWGQGCKKQGSLFRLKSQTKSLTRMKRIQYVAQACGYYTLFIFYRAYRGCFVILPAVFREVSRKLESAVELEDAQVVIEEYKDTTAVVVALDDVNPATGKLRWRTRITVAILASIVTFSYMLGGALRVLQSFGQTLTRTASVSIGLEAAANQVVRNENEMLSRVTKSKQSSTPSAVSTGNTDHDDDNNKNTDSINGQQPFPDAGMSSGLAP
jgi:AraC-like DNA-binding protein